VSTQNQAINAIKFYLENIQDELRQVYYVERPRKVQKLSVVLNGKEVFSLLKQARNIKHQAIIFLFVFVWNTD
jgi:integrase/recombinase XerD